MGFHFFDIAHGCVIFPRVSKGGFVVGGAGGKGLVYEKGQLLGIASLSQGTFGAQSGLMAEASVGGQKFDFKPLKS